MKIKKVVFFLLLLPYTRVFAQEFNIIPKAGIEYLIDGNKFAQQRVFLCDETWYINTGNSISKIGIEFKYKNASILFDNVTYMKMYRFMSFEPIQANYTVRVQYKIHYKIKFYYEHACFHTIKTQNDEFIPGYFKGYEGGYNKIGISYNY